MKIEFLNIFTIYFLHNCLFGFAFDNSRFPISISVKLFPFYKTEFGFYTDIFYDEQHDFMNKSYDLLIPFICDIYIVKELF